MWQLRSVNDTTTRIVLYAVAYPGMGYPLEDSDPNILVGNHDDGMHLGGGPYHFEGGGFYSYQPDVGEFDTVNTWFISMDWSGNGVPAFGVVQVVPWDLNDGVRLGLSCLPNANSAAANGMLTRGTGAGQINPTGGAVPIIGGGIGGGLTTDVLPEAYPANGAAATAAELLYLILANVSQFGVNGTDLSALKLDGVTEAALYSLNDAVNPTLRQRSG